MIFLCQMVHVRECSVSIFKKALMFGVFPLVQVLYRSLAGNQTKDLKGLELRSTGVCLKRWRSVLRETKNLKVKLLLIHFLNLLFGFKRGAVHVGWRPKAASHFLAFF